MEILQRQRAYTVLTYYCVRHMATSWGREVRGPLITRTTATVL